MAVFGGCKAVMLEGDEAATALACVPHHAADKPSTISSADWPACLPPALPVPRRTPGFGSSKSRSTCPTPRSDPTASASGCGRGRSPTSSGCDLDVRVVW